MALLKSLDIPLGTSMPSFSLKDPYGKVYNSDELMGKKGLLVIFTCNHCPYAIAVWPRVVKLAQFAEEMGINTVAINPNAPNPDYPEDSPEKMKEKIKELGIDFPYLIDETQEVAKSFKAQCTPDIYLFDKNGKLFYHGRIDDNWQDENAVKKEDLKEAIIALSKGKKPPHPQYPSMGCSIKWL